MGTVGDALDNAVAESYFASPQCELLNRHTWPTRAGLARAMFHDVETFDNPTRRHSTLGYLSPIDYETAHAASPTPNNHRPGNGVNSMAAQAPQSLTEVHQTPCPTPKLTSRMHDERRAPVYQEELF
jgi:putative transposase